MSSQSRELRSRELLIQEFGEAFAHMLSTALDSTTVLHEVLINSNDLFQLQTDSYIRSASERRDLMLSQSATAPDYQRQLKALLVPIPSNATPTEHCIFGPEGRRMLTAWADSDLQCGTVQMPHQALQTVPLESGSSDFKSPSGPAQKNFRGKKSPKPSRGQGWGQPKPQVSQKSSKPPYKKNWKKDHDNAQ